MEFEPTCLPEVVLIKPRVFGDARGSFFETWHKQTFLRAGIGADFVQDNHSSSARHTLRGLHYQIEQAQGKLVRVIHGEVFDVAVDIRRSSPRFGQWVGVTLSEENHHMLWVPTGFAHGYLCLSERADFVYKCTDFYAPQYERGLRWNDPRIGVRWPLPAGTQPVLSSKDQIAPLFDDAETYPVKVLVTGAAGQVGSALLRLAPAAAVIRAVTHGQLDIADARAVSSLVRSLRPEVIINAAAYTAVDRAEDEPELAAAINTRGSANLAQAARGIPACRLLHLSTDYVFDGRAQRPYRPDDAPNPLGVYGRSKLDGERAALESLGTRCLVLRTAWVYAPAGRNFVLTMLRLMRAHGVVRVVNDQYGTPTSADSIAHVLWLLAGRPDLYGVLHWTDGDDASWHTFACAIAEDARDAGLLPTLPTVNPIPTADYPTRARRPANSRLDCSRTTAALGVPLVPWRKHLRDTLSSLVVTAGQAP